METVISYHVRDFILKQPILEIKSMKLCFDTGKLEIVGILESANDFHCPCAPQ
jgi:hypothetical protein